MKTHFSHTLLNAVLRLADAPEHALSKVTARLSNGLRSQPASPTSAPDHVIRRLESVFDAMSDLSLQPDTATAFDLVCTTLQAELPTAAVAAGLYDINSDQIRIVAARGLDDGLLRGVVMQREQCLAGRTAEHAIVISGAADGANWLGTGEQGTSVLLCPILHDAHLLGVLALAEPLCVADFDNHDIELVGYVANQLATFIQGQRLRPSLAAPAIANSR
jgi:GAF domain-containing protein